MYYAEFFFVQRPRQVKRGQRGRTARLCVCCICVWVVRTEDFSAEHIVPTDRIPSSSSWSSAVVVVFVRFDSIRERERGQQLNIKREGRLWPPSRRCQQQRPSAGAMMSDLPNSVACFAHCPSAHFYNHIHLHLHLHLHSSSSSSENHQQRSLGGDRWWPPSPFFFCCCCCYFTLSPPPPIRESRMEMEEGGVLLRPRTDQSTSSMGGSLFFC